MFFFHYILFFSKKKKKEKKSNSPIFGIFFYQYTTTYNIQQHTVIQRFVLPQTRKNMRNTTTFDVEFAFVLSCYMPIIIYIWRETILQPSTYSSYTNNCLYKELFRFYFSIDGLSTRLGQKGYSVLILAARNKSYFLYIL